MNVHRIINSEVGVYIMILLLRTHKVVHLNVLMEKF